MQYIRTLHNNLDYKEHFRIFGPKSLDYFINPRGYNEQS